MTIAVVGINHKPAPLEIRERFSFREDSLAARYQELMRGTDVREAFILSTCNRVEIYAAGQDPSDVADRLDDFLCATFGVSREYLKRFFYRKDSVIRYVSLPRWDAHLPALFARARLSGSSGISRLPK